MSLQGDFQFIEKLTEEFFRRPHVRKILKAIEAAHMTGWEKWLQIEFAEFLNSHPDIKAWWRESQYLLDKRLVASRKNCAVDFLIHQRYKQSHIALELKQANSPNTCLKNMLIDKKKIASIRSKKFDIRSVWCLGVHKRGDPNEVRRLLTYHADAKHIDISLQHHTSTRIARTEYAYTIF